MDYTKLKTDISQWATELGFAQVGISDLDLSEAGEHLNRWLEKEYYADMDYMHKHGAKRYHPEMLVPGTLSIISARLNYMDTDVKPYQTALAETQKAAVSRYALGRDYHKLMRNKLKKLAQKIEHAVGELGFRVFSDSAPVMEKAIAEKAGLGWIGKHSNVINPKAGSYFFLGEIYTDLPLPADEPQSFHCGSCTACIPACPTGAIVAPFQIDARRCISYLTIENHGVIPEHLRSAIGNRIYGCDDCQMVCPWNKFTEKTQEADFSPRQNLDDIELLELFDWTEKEFLAKTEGSPIRRIGYQSWQRNLAVALGNARTEPAIVEALTNKLDGVSDMVKEHIEWALQQHTQN
ncbi:MAG: tRNA epoxyqueuosine(34) reductase QueG [Proteobacteria bacterium]|nr:MAG: tRNA epoxyqueuosine(34) reductase QueG [Pseudomonadota bacterium]